MSTLHPSVTARDNQTGNTNATLTLVEYGDYQCPYCAMARPIIQELLENHGAEFRFVFRHFPMQGIHEFAMGAALCAEAAGNQGKYWEMHELILQNQYRFDEGVFVAFARELNLNIREFKLDILDPALREKIESDFESGLRSGVNGTPSFYVNGMKVELKTLSYGYLMKALGLTEDEEEEVIN